MRFSRRVSALGIIRQLILTFYLTVICMGRRSRDTPLIHADEIIAFCRTQFRGLIGMVGHIVYDPVETRASSGQGVSAPECETNDSCT